MSGPRGPIRVLHLRDSPWIDGPGRTILETAGQIDRSRVEYHVAVLTSAADGSHALARELRNRGLPVHEILDDGTSLLAVARRVAALVDQHRFEILHASELRSSILCLLCRVRRRLILIRTAHGWIANDWRGRARAWVDRLLVRWFDRVIAVSHATRRRLPRWWVPDRRVRILHNALVLERFRDAGPAAGVRRQIADAGTTLLNVGRLSPEKGQALLLRALAALAPQHPRLRLLIAGTGPMQAELAALASGLGIGNSVSFIGYATDMESIYARASLVVQSSLTEGLPNVVLEAAYLGVPIVATDVGGTAEVIEHGRSGWLIRPDSVDALIGGIRAYLEDPERFAAMTAAARARVVSQFSFASRTEAQTGIYAEFFR